MRPAILVVLAALLVLPGAASHIEPFTQAKGMGLGPYAAIVQPIPDPAYENGSLAFKAIFSRASDGTYADVSAYAEATPPGGPAERVDFRRQADGYSLATFSTGRAGTYVVRIVARDEAGEHANETTVRVYRELGLRFKSDERQPDPVVGSPYAIAIRVTDVNTGEAPKALDDLTLVIEHWTDDHSRMDGLATLALEKGEAGAWTGEHVFPSSGMYHLRFASKSGGFVEDDVPTLHTYALGAIQRERLLPLDVATLALAALAAALLVRR